MWATLFVSLANFFSYQLLFVSPHPLLPLLPLPSRARSAQRPLRRPHAPPGTCLSRCHLRLCASLGRRRRIDNRFLSGRPVGQRAPEFRPARRRSLGSLNSAPPVVVAATAFALRRVFSAFALRLAGGLIGRWRWLGTGLRRNSRLIEGFFGLLRWFVGVARIGWLRGLLGEASRHPLCLSLWFFHVLFSLGRWWCP
jgi:hypothetical protein